jgi:hypothetical protein
LSVQKAKMRTSLGCTRNSLKRRMPCSMSYKESLGLSTQSRTCWVLKIIPSLQITLLFIEMSNRETRTLSSWTMSCERNMITTSTSERSPRGKSKNSRRNVTANFWDTSSSTKTSFSNSRERGSRYPHQSAQLNMRPRMRCWSF